MQVYSLRRGEKEPVPMHLFAWWPMVVLVVTATVTDLWRRRIPNWLTLPFLAAGIAVCGWQHGWHGIGRSLAGAALGLGIYGLLFVLGGMGAGDVKLAAATGAWIGPWQLFIALILTALVGGVMALGWAISKGFTGELFASTANLLPGQKKKDAETADKARPAKPAKRKMPYAPAIAIGTLLSFFAH